MLGLAQQRPDEGAGRGGRTRRVLRQEPPLRPAHGQGCQPPARRGGDEGSRPSTHSRTLPRPPPHFSEVGRAAKPFYRWGNHGPRGVRRPVPPRPRYQPRPFSITFCLEPRKLSQRLHFPLASRSTSAAQESR